MKQILELLKKYEDEFISFMNIETFPSYELETKDILLENVELDEFISCATASYQTEKNIHTLQLNLNFPLEKSLLFHEFTHIYDVDRYVKGDKGRNLGITCYTEYHASQVALMQMLGAKSVDECITFSMDDHIVVFEKQLSVSQYLNEKHKTAIALFSSDNLLLNIYTFMRAVGVLCNYFGLRSICKMYSKDYTEVIDNDIFLETISTFNFSPFNRLMRDWLDDEGIEKSITLCFNIINEQRAIFNIY